MHLLLNRGQFSAPLRENSASPRLRGELRSQIETESLLSGMLFTAEARRARSLRREIPYYGTTHLFCSQTLHGVCSRRSYRFIPHRDPRDQYRRNDSQQKYPHTHINTEHEIIQPVAHHII
ncbi:MAG: hypothetical protein JWQ30_356 [Sediminibacterium sp.]|nr:hypothetical protein [Sediminibacterium sp.]